MVCGSDRQTYETICSLNEEAVRRGAPSEINPAISMTNWGPCKEGTVRNTSMNPKYYISM